MQLAFYKKIFLVLVFLVLLVFVAGVSFLIYKTKSGVSPQKQTPTKTLKVTPLPPTVTPGRLLVQTLPSANVTLKFWTRQWGSAQSPSSQSPNTRTLQQVEIPNSASTQTTNSKGIVEFSLDKIPMNAEADITIEKGKDKIHFQAALDPYFGAVFIVPVKDGKLTIDFDKTEFAPGKPAGEHYGPDTRKADQKASLTILEN